MAITINEFIRAPTKDDSSVYVTTGISIFMAYGILACGFTLLILAVAFQDMRRPWPALFPFIIILLLVIACVVTPTIVEKFFSLGANGESWRLPLSGIRLVLVRVVHGEDEDIPEMRRLPEVHAAILHPLCLGVVTIQSIRCAQHLGPSHISDTVGYHLDHCWYN